MVWFKVDDKLHSHSKVRKVLAEQPAALALWTVAGSWSADSLTDGFVPDHQLPWLLPSGAEQLAATLVAARLWKRVRGGYQFHEWDSDGNGSKRNPTKSEVEDERRKKAEAGRKGGLASGQRRSLMATEGKETDFERVSNKVGNTLSTSSEYPRHGSETATNGTPSRKNGRSKDEARASANALAGASRLVEPPTRPDPTFIGGTGSTATNGHAPAGSGPPAKCETHQDNPDPPPCGRCADARRNHERWQATEANRRREAPKCRIHRGEPAHNCGRCRSDALAGEAA